jgi:hypothetical protein
MEIVTVHAEIIRIERLSKMCGHEHAIILNERFKSYATKLVKHKNCRRRKCPECNEATNAERLCDFIAYAVTLGYTFEYERTKRLLLAWK